MSKHWTIIHIRDGKITNPQAAEDLYKRLKKGDFMLEANKPSKRSNEQNRYYWGVVVPLVRQGLMDLGFQSEEDLGGELTAQETHEFLKSKFNYSEILNEQTGEMISVPRSTTALTKSKFMDYLAKIQQFSAEWLNTVIPDPGEQTTLKFES